VPSRRQRDDRRASSVCQTSERIPREPRHPRSVVCIGDSLVRGQVSIDFIDILRERLSDEGFRFFNHGVNGDLSYNVLIRLDAVVACQPEFVIVLVGGNDVNATLSPALRLAYRLWKRLPEEPVIGWYYGNMLQIVKILKEKTPARIALVSPPILGEHLTSLPNERIRAYSAHLMQIATEEQVTYLPVHERQEDYLYKVHGAAGRRHHPNSTLMWTSLFRHYVLRRSFDAIARENGFLLTTEGLHLNGTGAAIVADTIEPFLRAGA
jgi:lysophospholipase L1-like esterase